ncbi:MAG: cytochrome P450 [Leptolyngbyaceae cyanobacterium RM1_405_57]|nr:cytochrome P450 [Leptolyngbyaceae cyanobacterium RM1_405_57]
MQVTSRGANPKNSASNWTSELLSRPLPFPRGPKTATWLQTFHLMTDPLGYMESVTQDYGDIFTLQFLFVPTVFVSGPEGMQQLFTNTKEITAPGEPNKFVAPLVGSNGLLLLDGARHKYRRKLLTPAFHGDRIRAYGQRICAIADAVMRQQPVGSTFTAISVLDDICLRIILEVVFGLREGDVRYDGFRQVVPALLKLSLTPAMDFCFSFPILQQNWGPWKQFCQLIAQFDDLIYGEIRDRRHKLDSTRSDVLSDLIFAQDEQGEAMPDEEIRDLVPSLIFAGQEASATAIAWALYWVHHLPAVKKTLLQELNQLGDTPDPMSIVQLPYLSAVCNESLRIYPTQTVTFPRVVQTSIEMMGYELTPGTVVRGNIYLLHQQEDLYPNPKQFKPERFLERQYSNYEFLPFGGGARRCPGDVLALFELKLVLATLLSHYQLELVDRRPERPQRRGVTFSPASGLKMKLLGLNHHAW